MYFFDSLIDTIENVLNNNPHMVRNYDSSVLWTDVGFSHVVLQRDTAFELDGTGCSFVTDRALSDEVIVVGEDLPSIKKNSKFARITIVSADIPQDDAQAYDLIKKVEFVRYHYFPDGYMVRSASTSFKENVRVSNSAIKNGVSFFSIGNLLINKYKELPQVKNVKVIFIALQDFDYSVVSSVAVKKREITETLNQVMNELTFDCSVCELKPICDEVEGMRELHFNKSKKRM